MSAAPAEHPLMAPPDPADRRRYQDAFEALTPKHRLFVNEYLQERNGMRAYKKAFPRVSLETARAEAPLLLANLSVKACLIAYDNMMAKRVHLPKQEWLAEEAVIGFSDITHYDVSPDGKLVLTDESLPPRLKRAVESFKRKERFLPDGTREVTTEIKLWSKPTALSHIGKHLGFLAENNGTQVVNVVNIEGMKAAYDAAVEAGLIPPVEPPRPRPKEIRAADDTVDGKA